MTLRRAFFFLFKIGAQNRNYAQIFETFYKSESSLFPYSAEPRKSLVKAFKWLFIL